jgi:hypothetical protein
VPIGQMWNSTGRAFGAALSGQTSPEGAAKQLLDDVSKQLK